ncbi:hypothetical protein KW790_01420 [Candidatus Parcubacteria bacterium]|nr:hypothetical protein [Candidatus Parcubacteria bacterium]
MKNLDSLLERISKSLGRSVVEKDLVISCLKKVLDISFLAEDISIKNGTLEIHTTPTKKSLIKIKESQILRELNEGGVRVERVFYK